MSVDVTPWDEDPAKNTQICGMRLARSAPIANTGNMVATLMAAIKGGDLRADVLTSSFLGFTVEVQEQLDDKAPAFDSITNLEIYNMMENEDDGSDEIS